MNETQELYMYYTLNIDKYIDNNNDKIKSKIYKPKCSSIEYKILNYDNTIVCNNDNKLGMYRSVIVSHPENKIVSFAPPKSMTLDFFKELNPDIQSPDIIVNEIIEGTMISLFYDQRIQSWEVASKGAVGCNYWFYRLQYDKITEKVEQPTFRKMFLDVFNSSDKDINDMVFLQNFSKEYCYTFVLQHPSNHIVLNISKPTLYLVSVYQIKEQQVISIPAPVYEKWDSFINLYGLIEFPKKFDDQQVSYETLEEKYCSPNSPHDLVGLMITNFKTGMRTCLENPTYKEVCELRGNNPNLQYQYLCLLRMSKVMEFLNYFPQYKEIFYRFFKQFQDFITNIHQSYVSYYVKKNGQKISKKYFPLIYKLHHDVYLPSLAEGNEKIIMRRSEIGKRIGQMAPIEIIYYLNYNKDENENV